MFTSIHELNIFYRYGNGEYDVLIRGKSYRYDYKILPYIYDLTYYNIDWHSIVIIARNFFQK